MSKEEQDKDNLEYKPYVLNLEVIKNQQQFPHVADLVRKCHLLRGPSAELLQIRDTDHYVCREGAIKPVPVEIMQRYALMGGGK